MDLTLLKAKKIYKANKINIIVTTLKFHKNIKSTSRLGRAIDQD